MGKNEGERDGAGRGLSMASGSPWQLGAALGGYQVGLREGRSFARLVGSKTEIINQNEKVHDDVWPFIVTRALVSTEVVEK